MKLTRSMKIGEIPCPKCGACELQVEGRAYFNDREASIDFYEAKAMLDDVIPDVDSADPESVYCRECGKEFSIEEIADTAKRIQRKEFFEVIFVRRDDLKVILSDEYEEGLPEEIDSEIENMPDSDMEDIANFISIDVSKDVFRAARNAIRNNEKYKHLLPKKE